MRQLALCSDTLLALNKGMGRGLKKIFLSASLWGEFVIIIYSLYSPRSALFAVMETCQTCQVFSLFINSHFHFYILQSSGNPAQEDLSAHDPGFLSALCF